MRYRVTVIDYGISNLLNVVRAFEHLGAEVNVTNDPDEVVGADRLVLPGVGAFGDGMAGLNALGLVEPIRRYVDSARPFLGICLGMQMMLDRSEEFGSHRGLGLISGEVVAIPAITVDGRPHKIPHIGWNTIVATEAGGSWRRTVLDRIEEGSSLYFVHSYMVVPADPTNRLADCDYGGHRISAVIRSGNIYGCQFHPEKSGEVGLRILRNFLAL